MSDEGVFAVHRSAFKHPIFADEPYTEREAWFWLLGNAAWKPMRVRAGKATVDLQRGQLAFAGRFLATKWKWSESRVRRFLNRIEIDAMIVVHTTRQTTQITICNYDKYQFSRRTDEAQTDAQTDEQATHERRKEEEVNKGISNNNTSLRSVCAPKRGMRLPEDWKPDEQGVAYALTILRADQLNPEIENFTDYWKAASGQKAVKRDWSAAWRTWVRNSVKFNGGGNGPGRPRSVQTTGHEVMPAIEGVINKIKSFGGASGVCGTARENSVRLLPQGGGERPGDVHSGGDSDPGGLFPGGDSARH